MEDGLNSKCTVFDNNKNYMVKLLKEYCKLYDMEYDINNEYFNDELKNNLNWYSFKENSKILEIGSNFGDLTLMLLQKNFSKVDSLVFSKIEEKIIHERINNTIDINKNIMYKCYLQEEFLKETIKENTKYDYITIVGFEDLINRSNFEKEISLEEKVERVLTMAKNLLNQNGKIFITFNNYLGIKNFSYVSKKGVAEIENDAFKKYKIFTKTSILNIIKKLKLNVNNILYPFPNYIQPKIILSDDCEEVMYNVKNYSNFYPKDTYVTLNENVVMHNILGSSSEFIGTFANSIFLELGFENVSEINDIKLISFNNERKDKYKLITIIQHDKVEKIPSNSLVLKHLSSIKNNLKYLKKYEVENLDYTENGRLFSSFVENQETLDKIIYNNRDNMNYIIDIFNNIENILLKQKKEYDNLKAKWIIKIIGEQNESLLRELNYVEYGFWDMIPKNCFLIKNKFYFFDQEWMVKYLPIEFIIYRGIINCYDYVRVTDLEEVYEKLNLLKYIEIFEKVDRYFRDEIFDEDKLNRNSITDQKGIYSLILESNEVTKLKKYVKSLESKISMFENENLKKEQYILDLQSQNKDLEKRLNSTLEYKIKNFLNNKGEKS